MGYSWLVLRRVKGFTTIHTNDYRLARPWGSRGHGILPGGYHAGCRSNHKAAHVLCISWADQNVTYSQWTQYMPVLDGNSELPTLMRDPPIIVRQ